MPAAMADAAIVAESPRPNAVPLTEASAESMTRAVSCVELPSPASFPLAWSIALSRSKPLVKAVDTACIPTPIAFDAPMPSAVPSAVDIVDPMRCPAWRACPSAWPSAERTCRGIPEVSAVIVMYAVASSTKMAPPWDYAGRMGKKITDEMVDAELARQDYNRQAGVVEIEGRVDANLSFWQLVSAMVVANLITAVVVGIVVAVAMLA